MKIFRISPVYFDRENMEIFNFIQNQKNVSNIVFTKYLDLHFYANRSSPAWFTRAIRSLENASKMSPAMSCSNGADHV